jgi:hypothetical protein
MSETSTATATLSAEISAAVQDALTKEQTTASVSAPQAQDEARAIYHSWRNARLGGLPPDAFRQVEAASADLISAIAAKLTSHA